MINKTIEEEKSAIMERSESLRQTGRSTRMLKHAVELSKEKFVYVVVHCRHYGRRMRDTALGYSEGQPLNMKFITIDDLLEKWNYRNMKIRREQRDHVLLLDHLAAEILGTQLEKAIHAYDAPL